MVSVRTCILFILFSLYNMKGYALFYVFWGEKKQKNRIYISQQIFLKEISQQNKIPLQLSSEISQLQKATYPSWSISLEKLHGGYNHWHVTVSRWVKGATLKPYDMSSKIKEVRSPLFSLGREQQQTWVLLSLRLQICSWQCSFGPSPSPFRFLLSLASLHLKQTTTGLAGSMQRFSRPN